MSFFIFSVFGFILSKVTYAKDVTVQPHILFVVADDLGLSSFSDMILQVVKTVSRTSSLTEYYYYSLYRIERI